MAEKRQWTQEQRAGIETVGTSLLLSAAAGSGKTAVLAERCAHLVCDTADPCDVDELLVVTFTEAAAAEMRGRIEKSLRQRIGKSDDARLSRQLFLVERANVSTLHSFCTRILRQHFHVLGIDPGFTVLDEADATLLRIELAREVVHKAYEGEHGEALARLVDACGDGRDEAIVAGILHLHALMCSVVDPDQWLQRAVSRIAEGAKSDTEKSELGRELKDHLAKQLAGASRRCNATIERIGAMRDFPKYVQQLEEIAAALETWQSILRTKELDALAAAYANRPAPPRAPSYPASNPKKIAAKAAFDAVRDEMKSGAMAAALRFSCAQWRHGLAEILPNSETLIRLVREFSLRYREEKDKLRAMDFADLERFALRALSDDRRAPSAVARMHHRQFKHVLVDEYQDINEVQDTILRLISRECLNCDGNLFAVGDVKQSIYRFRLAEPGRFLNRAKVFREDASRGRVIDLRANFRSRGKLIDAINSFFERVMTEEAVDIEYDATHRLMPGMQYPPGSAKAFAGGPIELHLLPDETAATEPDETDDADDSDRTDREAWLIARRIREMIDEGREVWDKEPSAYRAMKYGDIAVLMRTAAFKAQQIAGVLREHGIPAHAEGRSGFFEATEIRDMICLLEILDNLQQDIPLAAFLRSPLANLAHAEDALARIRLAFPDLAFHEAVVRYSEQHDDELAAKLRDLLATLKRWRTGTIRRPIAEIIWAIYEETGFLAFASGLVSGERRKANLLLLHERARQFGTFQKQGLARFMAFLRSLSKESDLGQALVASDADNAVKIMSIHQSKGLEFPVVFVPDLGKKFNLSDTRGPILAERETFLGMMVVDDVKKIRYPSLAYYLVQQRLLQQTLAEEMRILYVAMTRAKEHLILIGTAKEKDAEKWALLSEGKLPADAVLGAKTMLDWIGPGTVGLAQHYQITRHTADEVAAWAEIIARPATNERLEKLARLEQLTPEPPRDAAADEVIARLAYVYPNRSATLRPAAVSVTRIAKHADEMTTALAVPTNESARLALPRCCQAQTEAKGTDIGTATHLVLQHLNFSGTTALEQQIEALVARQLLTKDQAGLVRRDTITWFLESALGTILRNNASAIRREVPINFAQDSDGHQGLDCTMVRGRIDLLLVTSDALVIADYKTDRVTGAALDDRAATYGAQLALYRSAIERILNRTVTQTSLVFLHAREVRNVPQGPPFRKTDPA